jgi:outer membrane receptor protein involved in Fe transport
MHRKNKPVVVGLLMLTELLGGCALEEKNPASTSQAAPPFAGEAEVVTGTATPHKQKDAPVEMERITGKQLDQAGASHVGQMLQDIPAIQPRR